MNSLLKTAIAVAGLIVSVQATAQIIFYEYAEFEGSTFTADEQVSDFSRIDFNNRASSIVVLHDPWEVCENSGFGGRCVTLRPGNYSSLAAMGLNNRISSARPQTPVASHFRRSDNEQLFEADVISARAVLASAEQRCWVEREQVAPEKSNANIPGAIVGAIIGGILGHQVGGGSGQNFATAGGVVVGAAVGSKVGQGNEQATTTQDIRRCSTTPVNTRPEYWDVSYRFHGVDHHVQMRSPPGTTIFVNSHGEPRE